MATPKKKAESLEFSGTLSVTAMLEPVDTGYPYWRNTGKKPCEQPSVGSNKCWKDASRTSEHKLDRVTKSACEKAKGVFEQAPLRPMDQGRVELDFISVAQAAKLGPAFKPGPILRLCHRGQTPGRLVQVKSPNEAESRARAFQSCIEERVPDVAQACATKLLTESAPLGGMLGGMFRRR